MASNATSSFAVTLLRGDGNDPENFALVAEVRDIKPPQLELGTEEVTHRGSPDGWKEYIGTLLDGGEVEFDVNFLPSEQSQLAVLTDMRNRSVRNWQVKFPDNTVWGFAALVTKFAPDAPVEGALKATITLKITGAVTFTTP